MYSFCTVVVSLLCCYLPACVADDAPFPYPRRSLVVDLFIEYERIYEPFMCVNAKTG